jgi:hypothetical protein
MRIILMFITGKIADTLTTSTSSLRLLRIFRRPCSAARRWEHSWYARGLRGDGPVLDVAESGLRAGWLHHRHQVLACLTTVTTRPGSGCAPSPAMPARRTCLAATSGHVGVAERVFTSGLRKLSAETDGFADRRSQGLDKR